MPVTLDAPLNDGLYTLEYRTTDIGGRVTATTFVPVPGSGLLFLSGLVLPAAKVAGRRRSFC